MMKKSKLAASVCMVALCISVTACGGKTSEQPSSSTDTVSGSSDSVASQTTQTGATESGTDNSGTDMVNSSAGITTPAIQISGKIEGQHYENNMFNVYADLPDTYVIYSDEDLGQEYDDQVGIMQALAPGNVNYMDLVAQDSMTSENIQIMITHVNSMKDRGKSVDEWLQSSMDSFKKSLVNQGATELAAEIAPLTFAGETVQSIQITCVLSEKPIEQQFLYKTAGEYVMMIALSAEQGRTPVLMSYFYGG